MAHEGAAFVPCRRIRLKIFLSYASEDRTEAERINLALIARGHDVFFDREDLRPGEEYDRGIARAVEESDLLVFLLTAASVSPGRYTLTELKLAERKWPHPSERLLPVLLRPTERAAIPAYLRAVTMLEPSGDVAAEVAAEVEARARSRSAWMRALRFLRSRPGKLAAGAVLIALTIGGIVTLSRVRDRANEFGAVPLFPDRTEGTRARAAARTSEGFVIAMANPPELMRFSETGTRFDEPISLRGRPAVLRDAGDQLLVATEAPDAAMVFSTKDWSVVIDAALDPEKVAGAESLHVSGDIRSLTSFDGELWAATGVRDGDPTLLHLRLGRLWSAVSWPDRPELAVIDSSGLELRTVAGQLWGVQGARASPTSPANLYRIFGTVSVQAFSGREVDMIRCANDLAESANGNLLLLDCDNRLLEINAEGNLVLVSARETLPPESGPGRWSNHILARDGPAVFVALNTEEDTPDGRPWHARIARLDQAGATLMYEEREAVVASLAVTPLLVIAVLRRAEGGFDAISIPRAPAP